MKRALKNLVKQNLRRAFEVGQLAGVDVLPRHFYSQVPDVRELRKSTGWRRPRRMESVRGHQLEHQLRFAERVCEAAVVERAIREQVYEQACASNGEPGYGPIEAVFLYAFVRAHKPRRVVQVGSGVSTAVILTAADHAGYDVEVCCIDPFPTPFLRRENDAGRIELLALPAQECVAERAARLQAGDLMFVDSTHVVKPGSEVNVIILDVLPVLARGMFVHFHDITFPYDYTRRVITEDLFFPAESTLLHAFLSCNDRYEICASLSMLHYAAPERLKQLVPNYQRAGDQDGLLTSPGHFPSATYLQTLVT
ncbi:MAG TPA: class I SAM-dependent methyltransferase [Polyangiales bacterium]|nr:class I SAM-dependent methyltransferase [Polyangiales bacterium]